jgi:hypothetical protein
MRSLSSFAILIAIGATAGRASAAVPTQNVGPCDSLSNTIFLQVGDTQATLMKSLARKLRDNTGKPLTMVWTTSGSCTNINNFYNLTPHKVTSTNPWNVSPSIADSGAWQTSDAPWTCTPAADGETIDIANSALFNEACPNGEPAPTGVSENIGAIQPYVLAVPEASTQKAITYEEAYFIFGFGAAAEVAPWTDPTVYFARSASKSTLIAWADQVGVTVAGFQGRPLDKSQSVVDALSGKAVHETTPTDIQIAPITGNEEKAIGLLGGDVYDANRTTTNALAYRALGQWAAYYPDSTSTSHDKKNVRDGHYVVWSPTVYMNYVTGTTPNKPDTQYIIDMISGKDVTPAANFDPSEVIARVGLVPLCAMRVTREHEQAPLHGFTPPEDCTCKFESIVDASSCQTCTGSGACDRGDGTQGVCRANYCEVR